MEARGHASDIQGLEPGPGAITNLSAQDVRTDADPASPAIGADVPAVDSRVATDLAISSLFGALFASAALILTLAVALVPGLASGVYLSASASPLAPPPWTSLYPSAGSGSAGSAAVAVSLTVGMFLMTAGVLAFAYRGLRQLRSSSAGRSEGDRANISRATYLFAGVAASAALFIVTVLIAVAIAISSLTLTTTPASYISGVQAGLASLAGVLAVCFAAGAILFVLFQRTVRSLVAESPTSGLSAAAGVLVPFGTALYFAIVLTPFEYANPFSTTLYLLGGSNGPWVWLTLPCWVFLSVGLFFLVGDWARLSARSTISPGAGDLPHRRSTGPRPRPARTVVTVLAIAILVTLGIYAVPSLGTAYGDLSHTACLGGTTLATETMWTPFLIISSPYGGNATGSWTELAPDGTGWTQQTTWSSNGSTSVLAALMNWTVYSAHTAVVAGPGTDTRCTSQYLAVASGPANVVGTMGLRMGSPGVYSDQNLPHQFNASAFVDGTWTNFSSMLFSANYGAFPNQTYSDCGGGVRFQWTESSESVRFVVPFEMDGAPQSAPATFSALTNYTYTSSTPGTYSVQDLGLQSSGFGSGMVFSYTPC